MTKSVEETVIVTVTMLGMAETGTGTATFNLTLDPHDPRMRENATEMLQAFTTALGEAMKDVYPAFQQYTKAKYGNEKLDNDEPI